MRQEVQHLVLLDALPSADLLGGLKRPTTGEDRKPAEQGPLLPREKPVAPVYGRPQGPMPGVRRPALSCEQPETAFKPQSDLLGREHPRSCRGELYGKRDAVQLPDRKSVV